MPRKKWAPGSAQYVKRPTKAHGADAEVRRPATIGREELRELTGVYWDTSAVDFDLIGRSSTARVRQRFRASLPDLIWNTAALEGNAFTLPEVRTLLDGTTIGGRSLGDEKQILALSEGYNHVDKLVGSGEFFLNREISNDLHGMVAVHEAIESGHVRGEGHAVGGGAVRLANGGTVAGREHGDGGEHLLRQFGSLTDYLGRVDDPRERALAYFAAATRAQFYFDGNKRTARLMMTGELMSHGYEVVSVPFSRRLEFNTALDELFETEDATLLMAFLATCTG